MRVPRFSRSSGAGLFDDDGCRTNWLTAVFNGGVLPLPLVVWGFWNLATWTVYWKSRSAELISHDSRAVVGMVLVKWGIAAVLFTWYVLANSPRFDRWIGSLLTTQLALSALGLILLVVGVLF